MRSYYKVLEKIKEVAEEDVLVNTVTNGDDQEFDLDKKNIYPLVDAVCTSAPLTPVTTTFNFTITVVDIRDINNTPRTDKFRGNDNKQDNLNTTLAIIKRIYLRLLKFGDDFDILGEPTPTPVTYEFKNLLDGWQMEISIQTPHYDIEVC